MPTCRLLLAMAICIAAAHNAPAQSEPASEPQWWPGHLSTTIIVHGNDSLVPLGEKAIASSVDAVKLLELSKKASRYLNLEVTPLSPGQLQVHEVAASEDARLYELRLLFRTQPPVDVVHEDEGRRFEQAVLDHVVGQIKKTLNNSELSAIGRREAHLSDVLARLRESESHLRKQYDEVSRQLVERQIALGESTDSMQTQLIEAQRQLRELALRNRQIEARQQAIEMRLAEAEADAKELGADSADEEMLMHFENAFAAQERQGLQQVEATKAELAANELQLQAMQAKFDHMKTMAEQALVPEHEVAEVERTLVKKRLEFEAQRIRAEQMETALEQELTKTKISMLEAKREMQNSRDNKQSSTFEEQLTSLAIELDENLATRDALLMMVNELKQRMIEQAEAEREVDLLKLESEGLRAQLAKIEAQLFDAEIMPTMPVERLSVELWGE